MNWKCRVIGHRLRYSHRQKWRVDRRGVMTPRDVTYVNCDRCGMGGGECYGTSWREKIVNGWMALLAAMEACEQIPREELPDDGIPF